MAKKKNLQKNKKPRAKINDVPVWCAYDEIVYLEKLIPNPDNPNVHPPEQIEMLSGLIREHGWRGPITVSNLSGYIVRGHGRYYAAVLAGLTQAPVDFQHYESNITETLDLIADNKIAELSYIDDDLARNLIEGLEMVDFDPMLAGYLEFPDADSDSGSQEEKVEVEFSKEIMLEHNYVVLYFDNPFDWQVAVEKFGLKKVRDLVPRKGQPTGIGRVLSGAEWLGRIK